MALTIFNNGSFESSEAGLWSGNNASIRRRDNLCHPAHIDLWIARKTRKAWFVHFVERTRGNGVTFIPSNFIADVNLANVVHLDVSAYQCALAIIFSDAEFVTWRGRSVKKVTSDRGSN